MIGAGSERGIIKVNIIRLGYQRYLRFSCTRMPPAVATPPVLLRAGVQRPFCDYTLLHCWDPNDDARLPVRHPVHLWGLYFKLPGQQHQYDPIGVSAY